MSAPELSASMKPYEHISKVTLFGRLKTYFCARLGNRSEIVEDVCIRHANTSIADAGTMQM
jgi:hypothetical protein